MFGTNNLKYGYVSIVDKEYEIGQRKIKEATVIMITENCLIQSIKDLPHIWFDILRNAMKGCDGRDRCQKFPLGLESGFDIFVLCRSEK